jgi:hypothetical protein
MNYDHEIVRLILAVILRMFNIYDEIVIRDHNCEEERE